MHIFEQKTNVNQQLRPRKVTTSEAGHFGQAWKSGLPPETSRPINPNRSNHDFSRVSVHNRKAAEGSTTNAEAPPTHSTDGEPKNLPANKPEKLNDNKDISIQRGLNGIPADISEQGIHVCNCGGTCPKCRNKQHSDNHLTSSLFEPRSGENFGQISEYRHNTSADLRGHEQEFIIRGPRNDGQEDMPYRGPDESIAAEFRGPGTGKGMGCVLGPMRVVTSGALEGGYSVNDYLSGGLSWGAVSSPNSAGADGRGFKAQLCAAYSNDTSLGVSQTMTHGGSNQAFLDGTASYLGRAAGSVTNGATFNEPVLNAGDPYAHTGWELQYGPKSGTDNASLVSFADVPRAGPGEKGYIDFRTCFYSHGGPCQENNACLTWRWTIDFTGTNNTNTVT